MPLRNTAYLEIDVDDTTAVFELREGLEDVGEITIQYLLSERGQYLREIYDIGTDLVPDDVADADLENRKGYYVDGGAGSYGVRLTAQAGPGDQWGDGSSNPDDEDDTTRYDATGSHPLAMKQVLEYAVAQSRTDSSNPARLYIGEWTDGTHADAAGAFEQPLALAIEEATVTRPDDNPSAITVTLEGKWTSTFPGEDLLGSIEDGLDEIADLIPDF